MKNSLKLSLVFVNVFFFAFLLSPLVLQASTTLPEDCRGLVCCTDPSDCDFDALIYTIGHIIRKVLEIAFVFIAIMFAYAGFKYMTSQGDTGQIQAAHDMFKKAAVGMIITLCSFLIIELITSTLGLDESIIKLVK